MKAKVVGWNNRFPLDYWWRKKYKIPFLSKIHRESTFYGQLFEFMEEKVFGDYFDNLAKTREGAGGEEETIKYKPLSGNWWVETSSNQEIDDWFNAPL